MKDVEMMKLCLVDADNCFWEYVNTCKMRQDKIDASIVCNAITTIAAELFNCRSFTCPVTWDDKPEGESDIPF